MRSIILLMATIVCTAATSASAAQPASSPGSANVESARERVRALYRRAEAAYLQKDFEGSRKLLLEAWAIQPNVDVALSLGQAEMQLELFPEAANHLEYALANFLPSESAELLQTVKRTLAEASVHTGRLMIRTNLDGAVVYVDTRPVGTSPLPSPVHVAPGQHEISASSGGQSAGMTTVIAAGGANEIALDLTPPSSAAGQQPAAAVPFGGDTTPEPAGKRPSVIPLIVGGAVLAVGIGAGVGFGVAANNEHDEAQSLRAKHGPSGCTTGAAPAADCEAQYDAAKSADRYYNLSRLGLVAAGVALVATPLYWFWPRTPARSASTARNWRLDGTASSHSAALQMTLAF